ncbi:MAG: right-handed parallel beta-helix repeat-containing protein [Candidatus Cloacimonetes bacterium]|nr:right-handed parallel beta-helix repeat-containing protein [Candidatus Cloacimonadota bacterium]
MKKKSMFDHKSLIKAGVFALMLMIFGQLQAVNHYHNTPITSGETWARWDYEEEEAITHIVQSGCYVAAGATLTLQDSCVVNVANPNGFNIYGGLNANGSSNEIHFSGEYITLSNATGNCDLDNCNFFGVNLEVDNCSGTVNVHWCDFSNGSELHIGNGSSPSVLFIEGAAIIVFSNSNPYIQGASGCKIKVYSGSAPTVQNCTFNNNTEAGGLFYGCGAAVFSNCSFNGNYWRGIKIDGADGLEFIDCNFNDNDYNGIEISGIGTGTTFTDCFVQNNGTNGVYATGGTFTFINVVIEVPIGNKPMDLLNANMTFSTSGDTFYSLTDSDFNGCNVTVTDCSQVLSIHDCNFSNGSNLIVDASHPDIYECVFDNADITAVNESSLPESHIHNCDFINGGSINVNTEDGPEISLCNFTGSYITTDNGYCSAHDCTFNGGGITESNNSGSSISAITGAWIYVANNSNPQISQVDGSYIRVESGSAPIVEYCTFNSTSIGGLFYGCGSAVFTNCDFDDNTDGIHINDADSLEFIDCNFMNNLLDGIKVEGTGATFFTSCEVKNNGDDGIHATGGELTFTNSYIYENGSYGMYLPYANMFVPMTITDSLRIESNGLAAIKINPNLVGRLPADSLFVFSDNNPDRVCVMEGYIAEDAVWLKRNYNICGDIGVDRNVTLQLPADCNLYFDNNTGIEIVGVILADSVNFEPILYGNWKGIHFYYNDPGNILNACKLERAGFRDDTSYGPASIMIRGDQDSTITITGCEILNGNGHGIYMYRSNPLIENCTISNCDGNGIDLMWSDPIITNTAISLSDSCGIYIGSSSEPYIDNCNIFSNSCYGIFAHNNSDGGTLRNGSIYSNSGPSVRIPSEMVRDIPTINIYGNLNNHQVEISGGDIDTDAVWYNNYDYILYGSPFIDGGTLTLEAGCVLKFDNNVDMDIRTSLTAIGTPENHIVFTSNQPTPAPGDWDKLYFDYCAQPSNLAYCDILYGGSGGWGSVVLWEHTANFDHCDISHSSSAGMCFWSDATAHITNSEIHHNATFGVESNPWNSVVHISDTAIHNNGDYAIQTELTKYNILPM